MKVDSPLGWDYHHLIEMLLTSSGSTSKEGRKLWSTYGEPFKVKIPKRPSGYYDSPGGRNLPRGDKIVRT